MDDKIIFRKKIDCGELTYKNKKDYFAEITIELRKAKEFRTGKELIEFSASGDIIGMVGGQCIDEIAEYFPDDKKIQRICEIWKRWHLNTLHAGCEHQRHLEKNAFDHIGEVCEICGYHFGTSWCAEEIPENIIEEIKMF